MSERDYLGDSVEENINLRALRDSLAGYLEGVASRLAPGRFRFCRQGSLVPTAGHQASMPTCFAVKAAWQAGLWQEWPQERRRGCVEFIRSFQESSGWFIDPWLERASRTHMRKILRQGTLALLGKGSWAELRDRTARNRRAETRQCAATLFMVGEKPPYPLPVEAATVTGVRSYVQRLDWRQPWSAGSHLSHLLFLLSSNYRAFGEPTNYEALIDAILGFLADIRDPQSGCWFRGAPPSAIKINGAMKVLSGLRWVSRPYPDCTQLLDFALRQPFEAEGCGFLNRVFVVREALRGVPEGYRQGQVRDLAIQTLAAVQPFRKPDGAFSFYDDHAATTYYGAPVSHGLLESDLHGCAMMAWAVALAVELLGPDSLLGSEHWRAHQP